MARMTKHRKNRGSRTHGKGQIQPGGRGGKGHSGSKKHRKSWYTKHKRDHLGKRGFIHRNAIEVKAINLRDIEKLAGDKKEIVLSELGYDKVLGSGTFTRKITIKAGSFSRIAKEKIEKAGGKAIDLTEPKAAKKETIKENETAGDNE